MTTTTQPTDSLERELAERFRPGFWCGVCGGACTSIDNDGTCSGCGGDPLDLRAQIIPSVAVFIREHDAKRQDDQDAAWQKHLEPLHEGYTGEGCDSGDPRDWTLAAIRLRLTRDVDERDEREKGLRAKADAEFERGFESGMNLQYEHTLAGGGGKYNE